MPFENRFITAQRGPTTYRFLGGDLKTAKNEVQSKNVSAKVPTPAPIKPPVKPDTGFGESRQQDRAPGVPESANRDLSYRDLATIQGVQGMVSPLGAVASDALTLATAPAALRGSTGYGRSIQAAGGYLSRMAGAVSNTEQLARNEELRERASRTRSYQQATTQAQMTQATKAPTQNISTGAQRGGGGGVEAGIRGPGGRGSESFGQPGRGSAGRGGFDNGGFSRDKDFGGWT